MKQQQEKLKELDQKENNVLPVVPEEISHSSNKNGEYVYEQTSKLITPPKKYSIKDHNKVDRETGFKIAIVFFASLAIMCAVLMGSYIVGIYMSDINQKAVARAEALDNLSDEYVEERDKLVKQFQDFEGSKYYYDGVVNELYDINSFVNKVELEDWTNIYQGETTPQLDELLEPLTERQEYLVSLLKTDYDNKISNLQDLSQYFDEEGNILTDATLPKAETLSTGLDNMKDFLPKLIKDNGRYGVYSYNEFNEILEKMSTIETQTSKLYYAASTSEQEEAAREEADNEFELKRSEIEEQLRKELEQSISSELKEQYTKENQTALNEKTTKINSLQEQLDELQKKYDELLEKYESNTNDKTSDDNNDQDTTTNMPGSNKTSSKTS